MSEIPLTVVELEQFLKRAADLWTDKERYEFVDYIAVNPLAGDEITGTGGLRKVRWSRAGMGKRGGARVIYYYYNEMAPLYLITAYPKNEKDDLSPHEKAAFTKLVEVLKTQLKEQQRKKKR